MKFLGRRIFVLIVYTTFLFALSEYTNANTDIERDVEIQIENILKIGKRNLLFYKPKSNLNKNKQKRVGTPIEDPKEYSAESIIEGFNKSWNRLNYKTQQVLKLNDQLFDNFYKENTSEINFSSEIDYYYQEAVRWNMMKPFLNSLALERHNDIRGYYFLNKIKERDYLLENYVNQDHISKVNIKQWLLQMCFVQEMSEVRCNKIFNNYLDKNDLKAFYLKFVELNAQTYTNYFKVTNKREDIKYNLKNNRHEFTVLFKQPESKRIQDFVTNNVKRFWSGIDWEVRVLFEINKSFIPHLEFVSGVVAHASLFSGAITLDPDYTLDDEYTNWVFNHEFGHVLGFPDCYLEFYDQNKRKMIGYQIDTKNIMCSRAGKVLPSHLQSLLEAYGDTKD